MCVRHIGVQVHTTCTGYAEASEVNEALRVPAAKLCGHSAAHQLYECSTQISRTCFSIVQLVVDIQQRYSYLDV